MNNKLCVTSGYKFTDIDVLACTIAFAELNNCVAYIPGVFNSTIPETIRKWNLSYTTEFPQEAEQFVLVDVSNPKYISSQIAINHIINVYDHHTGFENFWNEKGHIEFIGACATQIYELFGDKIPTTTTANLLSTAIFANTLNFNASITTERDINAYNKLKKYTNLSENWIEQYYSEVEKIMLFDIKSAIKNDTKVLQNNLAIGQMELWNANTLLNNHNFKEILDFAMLDYENWFMNIPSIKDGKSYFITKSQHIKNMLSKYINIEWNDRIGISDKLYLRKEIIKICEL